MKKQGEVDHNFLANREILNLLWSFNICEVDFQRHISQEIRNDICFCQEAEIKGHETGHIFKIGICALSCPPSWQKLKDAVKWAEKDHHFSFILYDHQYKDEDELNEISRRIKKKNKSASKIFLAKVRPYCLYLHAGRTYSLTEGPLYDLQNELIDLQFNATPEQREFWTLFPSSLFEINSKRTSGLGSTFFRFPLDKALHARLSWSSDGISITVQGDSYDELGSLYNLGASTFQKVFPGGVITHLRNGHLYCKTIDTPLKEFALSNTNGRKAFLDYLNAHMVLFTDWVKNTLFAL